MLTVTLTPRIDDPAADFKSHILDTIIAATQTRINGIGILEYELTHGRVSY